MGQDTILMLETSTASCSVALSSGGKIIAERVVREKGLHSSLTAPFVESVLKDAGMDISDCDAVSVSQGPGSYTGLRVGVSTAKGLCFGASKPLIGIDTLEILVMQGLGKADFIVPMIDARRMEAYSARFDSNGNRLSANESVIPDENTYAFLLEKGKVLFIGDGACKFKSIITHPNALFEDCCPEAGAMLKPSTEALHRKEFRDVAYFEPFYMKEFVAGISKRSVL